jgi:hypothetical protein
MKKVLVLMLVLGMVSLANAAFSLKIQVGGSDVTQVYPDDVVKLILGTTDPQAGGCDSLYMTVSQAKSGSGSSGYQGTWTLAPSPLTIITDGSGLKFGYGSGFAGLPAAAGDYLWGQFTVPSGASGNVVVSFTGKFLTYDPPTGASIPIVPEPITIALLGLGGLFLRRRK